MSALPDLTETQQEALQKHAYAMLNALEKGQAAPWVRADGSVDKELIALLARGVQTLPQTDQELFFHRMGEALSPRPIRERSGGDLLYHATEWLNAAGHAIAHPTPQAGRDSRLIDAPGDMLADLQPVVAYALLQHMRDLPEDAHTLAQDALILFARDASKGWGLSNAGLVDAVRDTQKYYFTGTDLPESSRDARYDAIRDAGLDTATLQDFVIEPRYRERFQIAAPADPSPISPAPDNPAPDASVSGQATEGEHGNAGDAGPVDANTGQDAAPGNSAEHSAAENAGAGNAENAETTHDASASGEAPAPDEGEWVHEEDYGIFQDQVLPAQDASLEAQGQAEPGHDRGDWPGRPAAKGSGRKGKGHRSSRSGRKDDVDDSTLSGVPDPYFQGQSTQQRADIFAPPYQPLPDAFQNQGAGQGNPAIFNQGGGGNRGNGGTFVTRGPGLFAGLGEFVSGLRRSPAPSRQKIAPLHEQMRDIHGQLAEQRAQRQQEARAEKQIQSADRFLSRFNERVDLYKAQEPIQEMMQRVHEDRSNRDQFVREGVSDAKTQDQRHQEWASHAWEKFFAKHPKLQSALTKLESDAEQIPELVNPALASMDQLNRDPRAEREALLAKLDRANENSQGLPPSVPGKKNLAQIMGSVLGAIKNFLSRLFGGATTTVSVQPASTANVTVVESVQSTQRRAGP